MDIANLKIGSNTYGIKDATARNTANSAETKADQAILDSGTATETANTAKTNAQTAQNSANTAQTSANNANKKIDGSKIIGTFTDSTETLEISLEIGSI